MTATTTGSNNDGLPPREPTGDAMTQSGIDVVQALYRVALANHEDTIAHLVTPDIVWEILDGFPHGGIYAGIPAIFGQFFPKLQADFHDWRAQPDAFVDAGDTIVALGHYSGTLNTNGVHLVAPFCHLWTLKNGKLARLRQFADTATFAQAMPQSSA
jgi:ketosteroid isomerase-like protein